MEAELFMVAECNYFHILFNLFLLEFCKKHKIARCLFPISEKKDTTRQNDQRIGEKDL